jgi:hypothetical protein
MPVSQTPTTTPRTNGALLWDWILRISVPVIVLLAGAMISHEVRIQNIEGNRFTVKDGVNMEERISRLFPPTWLLDDIKEIKAAIKELQESDIKSLKRALELVQEELRDLKTKQSDRVRN